MCVSGRLKANTPEMAKLLGYINNQRGKEFNNNVVRILRSINRLRIEQEMEDINVEGKLLHAPGDIDVLVADAQRRRLYVLECKDLAVARNPHELQTEIENLYNIDATKKTATSQVLRKTQWVEQNVRDLLSWLGVEVTGKWKVIPMIVVDHAMLTPHLKKTPVPIIPIKDLLNPFG